MSHKKDINWKEKQEIGKLFSGLKRNLKIERMWNGDHTTINKEIENIGEVGTKTLQNRF